MNFGEPSAGAKSLRTAKRMLRRTSRKVNRFRLRAGRSALLDRGVGRASFRAMTVRTVQLVLHYDGSAFAGWQRQPNERTVQGELERVLTRLTGGHVAALGAGRTDAGVHARGQAVGVRVSERWSAANLRRALKALLPRDIWVRAAYDMRPDFHARYSALSRRYSYYVGTEDARRSRSRRHTECPFARALDRALLDRATPLLIGDHC